MENQIITLDFLGPFPEKYKMKYILPIKCKANMPCKVNILFSKPACELGISDYVIDFFWCTRTYLINLIT